jgi:hypothetical protein
MAKLFDNRIHSRFLARKVGSPDLDQTTPKPGRCMSRRRTYDYPVDDVLPNIVVEIFHGMLGINH